MNDNSDLLPNLVHEDAFEMQMRGYSRRQVDEFIARCRSQIRDLEQRLGRSLDEGEELRRDLATARQQALEVWATQHEWQISRHPQVDPDELGVVLRFGKYVREVQPGLNYHLPYPIETVLTPKALRVNKIDIGMPKEPIFLFESVFQGGILINKEDLYAALIAAVVGVSGTATRPAPRSRSGNRATIRAMRCTASPGRRSGAS